MKEKKYYEKLSLEEAEKQIRELVKSYLITKDAFERLLEERNKRWPTASCFDSPKDKDYIKIQKTLDTEIRKNDDIYSELFDLVKTIPIPKNKRACSNCAFAICRKRLDCEKRGISNRVYCNEYQQPNLEEGIVYIKPYFMTEKERAIETAKTFEDHVNDMMKQELATYKKTLKQLNEHLSKVKVEETTTVPDDILYKFEREERILKKSLEAWANCYDHSVIKCKEGPLKGMKMHKWSPNPKKFKKLKKKSTMCPVQAVAASIGLTKVPKDTEDENI